MWRRRNPSAGNTSYDTNLTVGQFGSSQKIVDLLYGDLGDESPKEASVSTADVERLLEFQVDQMQSTLFRGASSALEYNL